MSEQDIEDGVGDLVAQCGDQVRAQKPPPVERDVEQEGSGRFRKANRVGTILDMRVWKFLTSTHAQEPFSQTQSNTST